MANYVIYRGAGLERGELSLLPFYFYLVFPVRF